MNNQPEIRIFLGYLLNTDLKIQLNQSPRWKSSKIAKETDLQEISHQEKEYIGLFISHPTNYDQIKEKEGIIKSQIQVFCPKLNLEKHPFYLFPQTFLS